MSWNNGSASPDERPLHYLGCRIVKECLKPEHLSKLINRLDPQLGEAITSGVTTLVGIILFNLSHMNVHIWSSGIFTVVFTECGGHMGCSKRNAVDDVKLERGITIATSRAVSAALIEQRVKYEDIQRGIVPKLNLDTIVPLRRQFMPLEMLAKALVKEALMEEMKMDSDNAQAAEGLSRREQRNINAHDDVRSGRFRYAT